MGALRLEQGSLSVEAALTFHGAKKWGLGAEKEATHTVAVPRLSINQSKYQRDGDGPPNGYGLGWVWA